MSENESDRQEYSMVEITEELHRRLKIQARNLLLEYRLASGPHAGCVPHGTVEKLMRLYGELIAKLIFESMQAEENKTRDLKAIEHVDKID